MAASRSIRQVSEPGPKTPATGPAAALQTVSRLLLRSSSKTNAISPVRKARNSRLPRRVAACPAGNRFHATGRRPSITVSSSEGYTMRFRVRKFAHVLERLGLAMAGAACGLFVGALVGSSFAPLTSQAFLLFMMIGGAVGFYLGIDTPPLPFHPASGPPSND